MFKNLMLEFEKHNIKLQDIALELGITLPSLRKKLKGQSDFNILECLKMQKLIGDGNICLEYLFQKTV